jgi:hypothetical protein
MAGVELDLILARHGLDHEFPALIGFWLAQKERK